jgi:DNA ligase-1
MSKKLKPMLADTCDDVTLLRFPLYASPKLDGVRALVKDGRLLSRSLKPVPNKFVNEMFGRKEYNGMDGELIWGPPTSKSVYRDTIHATRNEETVLGKAVKFYVFDRWDRTKGMMDWYHSTRVKHDDPIVHVPQRMVQSAEELLAYEQEVLDQGYEGLILRSKDGLYKFGRSTLKEQGMLKLKRFTDGEFLLIKVEEELHNGNEAKRNELGRTARSSAKAGMVPTGRAGALLARDLVSDVEFGIGTGLDDEDREWFWKNRDALEGKFVGKYKSFLIGVKDKPRFPVYLGPREKWDL